MELAYVPSCIRPDVRLTFDQRILSSGCGEKMHYGYLRQFSRICTAWKQDTFLLTTKLTYLRSLLFRQQDGVNSVVRRVYVAISAKLVPTE